jgi:beta-lactamase regulating signal transducer with metallopeptidase domain/DUF4097 and DUF4098 domain-containing protein YvlB
MGSLLMPFALPFASHWHVLSLATIPAPAPLDRLQSALTPASSMPTAQALPSSTTVFVPAPQNQFHTPNAAQSKISRNSAGSNSSPLDRASASNPTTLPAPASHSRISLASMAMLAYCFIAAALLVRLFYGLASALRLWRSASPVAPAFAAEFHAGLDLRASYKVSTPVTIGSGVVLPADYASWTEEKLLIVLAHERSHVSQRDFHLQILASLYAALAWFSPLGWWLKHKLSDLGEAISDRSGLNAASNRSAYAQVLLEFAATPRPTLIGVTMARPSSISRRIERLLNDSYLRRAFSGGVRARVAVLAVPAVLFAAAALVRVQAATEPSQVAPAPRSATIASPASPSLPAVTTVPSPVTPRQLALAVPPSAPALPASVENAADQSEATFDRNLSFNGKLDLLVSTGAGSITFTRGPANQIHIHGIVKVNQNGDPAQAQQIAANPPIEQQGNTISIGGHQENLHNISIVYEIETPADTAIKAATGSGNITDTGVGQDAKLTTGSGNITATGIEGGFMIQTGSGNIVIDGTGQGDAKAQTGSGNIDLKGVHGSLHAQTGSGTIKASGTPSSPWRLAAGAGSIELATGNAPIDLDASAGVGSISVSQPMATQVSSDKHHVHAQINGGGPEVRIETGSGDIRID